jgi:hypothetical protein
MAFAKRDDFLAAVARDLGDPDGAIWTDLDLSRHLDHALANVADAVGAEDSVDIAATGADSYDLAAYPAIREALAVEWPLDQQPPACIRFHLWDGQLRLLDDVPPSGETLRLHYRKAYIVDDAGSDVPADLEELVVTGARAYALLQQAARTVATLNVDSWVSRRYEMQGERTLERFRQALADWAKAREDPPSRPNQASWYPTI